MSTRIGLISDVHATAGPVREALSVFAGQGVDAVLCAGDIAGYGVELERTVALLNRDDCHTVLGNHDLWFVEDADAATDPGTLTYFRELPRVLEFAFEGRKLYMVHASPPDSYMDGIRLLDEHGNLRADQQREWSLRLAGLDCDVLVVGHTHQVFAERLGETLVINPGSSKFNHSCGILSLPDLQYQVFPLSGRSVVSTWNWGDLLPGGRPVIKPDKN